VLAALDALPNDWLDDFEAKTVTGIKENGERTDKLVARVAALETENKKLKADQNGYTYMFKK
jgi:hypothetical protein